MAKEIIELLEYLKNEPLVQGAFWFEVIGAVITIAGVIAVFVYIFRQMMKMNDEMEDFPFHRRRK